MVSPSFTLEGPLTGQSPVCEQVLRALPDWFGLETAICHYIEAVNDLPSVVARVDGMPVGFVALKQHYLHSAEIYVMGVLPDFHRMGIGRAMLTYAEEYLSGQGVCYLQVKTLGPSHADPSYASTRAFYAAVGFSPLEEFFQLWDENNPCLVMVKWIGKGRETRPDERAA